MTPRHLTLLIATLATAAAAHAAEPLRWDWSVGDATRYLLTQTTAMTMDGGPAGQIDSTSGQHTVMRWEVDRVEPSGAVVLRLGCDRITMRTDGLQGQGFGYDSADDGAPIGMAAMVAPMLDAMVENDFTTTMLPSGEITDVQLSEDLAEAFKRLPGGSLSADMVTQMSRQGSIAFPEGPIEPGDTWTRESTVDAPQIGPMRLTTTYTYDGVDESDGRALEAFTLRLDFALADEAEAPVTFATRESSGKLLFDRAAGRLVQSEIRQVIDIGVTVGERTVTNVMTQTVAMRELAPEEDVDALMINASTDQPATVE